MRWLVGSLIVVAVALVLYAGTAIASVGSLVDAVRSGDANAIIARTDMGRLRSSLAAQIVGAYLERTSQSRPLKPFERMVASSWRA